MFYNYRRKLLYWRFNRAISGILETPPLVLRDAPWTFVSMVSPNHVPMYLLSMKAFYRRIGSGRVIAIIDRDTPNEPLEMMRRHIQGIEFKVLEDIDTGPCQRGGTWERILHILDLAEDRYIVQIDADVLSVAEDVREVLDCLEANRSFTMADEHVLHSMQEAADLARQIKGNYIGQVSERLFDQYPGHENLRYVRGSSGLAGFARGGFPRAELERFHGEMERLVGEKRWREWGTEQCASNFAVANSPGAIVLPYPAYASYIGTPPHPDTKCFHFIGTYRFANGVFAGHGQKEIKTLMRGAQSS
ncbi:hypothetical protein [Falsiroseomonas sp. E2-1-a4]|uniref:hypothetical protein n=1 Tax=Falsiroseomonas sp. E2-1-a4 TaxID=3239299 RepID=UPI003F3F53A6